MELGEIPVNPSKAMLPLVLLQKPLFTTQSPGLHIVSYVETTMGLTVTTCNNRVFRQIVWLSMFQSFLHRHARNWQDRIFKGVFCEYLWIFYIFILSCGVFSEWEADGNFLTRVSGSEKYSIFQPVGIYNFVYLWLCIHARTYIRR